MAEQSAAEVIGRTAVPSSATPALDCAGISKTFAGHRVLSSIDMKIERGRVRALLGENGSGKSTLVKILSGLYRPDSGGKVLVGGKAVALGTPEGPYEAGARFVHQDLGLLSMMSITDNLNLMAGYPARLGTIKRRAARRHAVDALARVDLDLDPDRLVGDLLPAERTGVAVAKALRPDPTRSIHLLVLDEPTATLREQEARKLLDIVRAAARLEVGVLYVSHHLDEVFDVADEVTVLRNGREVVSCGIEGLGRDQLITYLVGTEYEDVRREARQVLSSHGQPVLEVDNMRAERLHGVSFTAHAGEVVGLAGVTGSGRESVCGAVFGKTRRVSGRVTVNGRVLASRRPDDAIGSGVAFLPADRKVGAGFMDLSARENLTVTDLSPFWRGFRMRKRQEQAEVRRLFDVFDVRPRHATESPFRLLSGGNQQKLLFAKWLRRGPRLWLLDEPTHGVDLLAKAKLHHHVLQSAHDGVTVVLSSADIDELVSLCTRVLVLRNGQIVSSLSGQRLTVAEVSKAVLGEG